MKNKSARRMLYFSSFLFGVVFVYISVLVGCAYGEDCVSCNAPTFPEAQAFLAGKGYSEDGYTVLLAWNEAARYRRSVLVAGYHVLAKSGGATFDLYSDAAGNLLSTRELLALGVWPKDWSLPPIEQQEEIPPALAKAVAKRPIPVSTATAVGSAAAIVLPTVDVAALEMEDAEQSANPDPGKSARRVGIVRDLPAPIRLEGARATDGAWGTATDGSRVWAVTIESPGARAIRLRFTELKIPTGCRVIVYNSRNPVEAYGPFDRIHSGDKDLWSDSCFSDLVTVECTAGPGVSTDGLSITIENVVHTYKGFDELPWAKSAGTCNLDVTCYSDWAYTARGIGGFTFVSSPNQLHCTGTLIADSHPESSIAYFLTANHCVSVQDGTSGASSMEFYWLYQTSACDGTPPAMASVPRTSGGADLLTGVDSSVGSDFALVRLRNAPPTGLTYVGWTTTVPSVGTEVVAIHHPRGDFKRISFGRLSDAGSPQEGGQPVKPRDFFHESLWHLDPTEKSIGITESGSSGSPLMTADTHLIIGQLWGGYSSCTYQEEPDYFGRFDKTFPLVASWLGVLDSPLDVDASGAVNIADIQLVVNALLGMPILYNADVDSSGTVDATDLQLVIIAALGG